MKKIAIIGLGYVGLPLAVEFGKSRDIVGFDLKKSRVDELNAGIDETNECSKQDLASATHLTFSNKIGDVADAKIFIITVPTPIDNAKRPDLNDLKHASQMIGKILKVGDIVIYESTVFPGATEEFCVPELERASGLKFNTDFFCGYSPERINPGDKVNTLTTIKKITSGSNPLISKEVDALYSSIIEAGTWMTSSIKVAEAAKVIENTQRDLNIAFVNELSMLFARMGIDTMEVLEAAGSKWNFLPFRPGLVGGHCIGVDPYYLTHKAEELGYNPQVILSGRRINDEMSGYVANKIVKRMTRNNIKIKGATVGVLGITFKENCPDFRNSKVLDLINELESWDITVKVVDPWVNKKELYKRHDVSLSEINKNSKVDSLVIAVGHKQFRELNLTELKSYCNGNTPILADLKSIFSKEKAILAGFDVFRL